MIFALLTFLTLSLAMQHSDQSVIQPRVDDAGSIFSPLHEEEVPEQQEFVDEMNSSTNGDVVKHEKAPTVEETTQEPAQSDEIITLNDELKIAQKETAHLEESNSELKQQASVLEAEYETQQDVINETKEVDQKEIQALQRTLYDLEAYNNYLESKDDDTDFILEASLALVYVAGIGSLFLILHAIRFCIGNSMDENIKPALMCLLKDVSLLAMLSILTAVLNWIDIFDESQINFEIIFTGIALFILIWFLLGLWMVLAIQSVCRAWTRMETRCLDLERLELDFADAHDGDDNAIYSRTHRVIQYAVMRQEFICPTYLPTVKESYLRSDFDFADYLSKSIVKTYCETFGLSWGSFAFIIAAVIIWRFIVLLGNMYELIAFVIVPLFYIVVVAVTIHRLIWIYFELVPYIESPADISFPRSSEYQRDAYYNINRLPRPQYLEGFIYSSVPEFDNSVTVCCRKWHPFELSWSYMFGGRLPNRHEVLFWFDSAGKGFIQSILQAVCVTMSLWGVVIILVYTELLQEEMAWYSVFAIILSFMVWLFLLMYLVPEAMRILTITTNIGQMKDNSLIHATVSNQMASRELRNVRIYRQFKMIRRELLKLEEKVDRKPLPGYMVKQLSSAFKLHVRDDEDFITLDVLEDVIHLCGIDPKDDELRVLAKEAANKHYQIHFSALCQSIEGFMSEVTYDSQYVVRKVLEKFFNSVYRSSNITSIQIGDLKNFFDKYNWHFQERDVLEFLHEARFLLDEDSNLNIAEVASLIRDDIETFAK